MPYKIERVKEKFKNGQLIKVNVEYKIKDSVLNNTFGHVPIYFPIDTTRFGKYNFTEIIFDCGVGDKVDFRLSVDTLKKMGQIEYNKDFKRGDYINGKIHFMAVFASEAEMQADYNKEVESEKQRELVAVKEYATKKNFKTEVTPNGVVIVIEKAGNAPKLIVVNKQWFITKVT
jgi:hypothetical protein